MSPTPPAARLRFDAFELDVASGELFRDGERLPLQPQPARLLGLLLERAGQVVSREELRSALWGEGVHVDVEQGLAFAVKQLRRALGDTAAEPQLIETLPRRGYRLLVAVEPVPSPVPGPMAAPVPERRGLSRTAGLLVGLGLLVAALALWLPRPPQSAAPPRLAVLPFETFGAEASLEPVAAGLTEELITEITRRSGDRLGVIARTSVMPYRGSTQSAAEIARELGVEYLLEGSVRRQGEQLRVSAQLIRAQGEVHLWATSLDGNGRDLMAWETTVAQQVAAALSPRIFNQAGPEATPKAALPADDHERYLESLYLLSQPGPEAAEQARARLEALVVAQPTFAPAWLGLAEAHLRRWAAGTTVLPQARAALDRTFELAPDLPEAHLLAGTLAFRFAFDWKTAEHELAQALAGNPNLARAHHEQACLFAAQGHFEASLAALERARGLDPRSLWVTSDRGYFLYLARRYSESLAASREALGLDPSFHWARYFVRLAALAQGDEALALAAAREELVGRGGSIEALNTLADAWRRELSGLEHTANGRPTPAALLARPHLALGEHERALELLEEAVESRTGWYLPYLAVEPFFDPLRNEARFRRLLLSLGLPPG